MRRILSLVLAVMLLLSSASVFAAEIDFSAMSDDELHALVDGARGELARRELVAADHVALLEQDGISIYLTGQYEIENWGEDKNILNLEAVVINESDTDISVYIDKLTVNGWEVYVSCISEIGAGKQKKDTFDIDIYNAGLSSFEEIEDMEFVFDVSDAQTYETLLLSDTVSVHFNAEKTEN